MIREADAIEISGEDGLVLPGSLVGESQLRIQQLELYIMFSNRVPLVSVKLEYHAEWCALKCPSSSSDGPGNECNLLHRSLPGVCRRW